MECPPAPLSIGSCWDPSSEKSGSPTLCLPRDPGSAMLSPGLHFLVPEILRRCPTVPCPAGDSRDGWLGKRCGH